MWQDRGRYHKGNHVRFCLEACVGTHWVENVRKGISCRNWPMDSTEAGGSLCNGRTAGNPKWLDARSLERIAGNEAAKVGCGQMGRALLNVWT